MLVPGPWREPTDVTRALAERGIAAKVTEASPIASGEIRVDLVEDGKLAEALSWGRFGPLPDVLLARVAACTRAALVECGYRLDEAPGKVAALGRTLRDGGGVALRMEASGAASSWEPWLEQLESNDPFRIYASAVLIVQDDDGLVFTCGMHQFDLPDAQITMVEPQYAIEWLDAFCVFQLQEQAALASGHTFCPHPGVPRRSFVRWPDHRHHPDDGRHNPFGVWRFLGPDEAGLEARALLPTIVPSLAALLMSTESKAGRPLTRAEVESLVSRSPAIALEPRAVRELERSRGYADIEPELAWDQWQIVRRSLA